MQYGGGLRDSSLSSALKAFVNPSKYDNTNQGPDAQFGNQVAAITSQFIFPGRMPFSVYFEYGGEDTSSGRNYLLGNSSLSAGINFPRLGNAFDFTFEASEWQNGWYVHQVYGDGLTNYGHVIGHWGGDERQFGDAVTPYPLAPNPHHRSIHGHAQVHTNAALNALRYFYRNPSARQCQQFHRHE